MRHKTDISSAYLFSLSKEIRDKGASIWVLAPHASGLPSYEEIDGVNIYRFHYAPSRYERLAYRGNMHELVIKNFFNKLLFVSFIFSFALKALILTKSKKIDLIHAHWWIP